MKQLLVFRRLMAVLLVLSLGGCATTIGLVGKTDKAMPYFGVQFDSHILANPNELSDKNPVLLMIGYPLALIDLPLSAVADTLALPYMMQGKQSDSPH